MDSALIISCAKKNIAFFAEMLSAASIGSILTLSSCAEARRLLLERDFDLVIIDAPLRDETGESLARHITSKGIAQVILAVSSEHFDAVSNTCEKYGVLPISKPINKTVFWSALNLARAAHSRLARIRSENSKLKQKIEEIRIVDRAKCILISNLNMSEQEAHRHIEKQAMDMRTTRRVIAEGILKTYEN